VRPRTVPATLFCLLLTSMLHAQQIVFSHRVYTVRGRSYQQLWTWSADAGTLKQISRAGHDHLHPTCESDGRHILFDFVDDEHEPTRWRLDRVTGAERPLNAPEIGVTSSPREASLVSAAAECDADTARVSPDGTRVACAVKGTEILIADAGTHRAIARVPFGQHYSTGEPYAPWPMESIWSPDGRTLLVGNYGENGGSTTAEMDYFLLDLTTTTWRRAFTGVDALWAAPTLIVYITPRDLSPLTAGGTHAVWTAHITAFDPVSRRTHPITAGLSNDLNPAVCSG
jgi:hypothetical protein